MLDEFEEQRTMAGHLERFQATFGRAWALTTWPTDGGTRSTPHGDALIGRPS